MAKRKPEASAREPILEAAIRVASRDGLLSMTLDNVAREAGVSKGGLIYHFASKEELVRSLITHFALHVEQTLNAKVAVDPQPNGRWVRALLDSCVIPAENADATESNPLLAMSGMGKFHASLLAAVAVNPTLLEPLRSFGKQMRDRIQAEDPQALEQLLLWMALDGLFVWGLFGLISPTDPLRQELLNRIREKTYQPVDSPAPKKRSTKAPAKRPVAKKRGSP